MVDDLNQDAWYSRLVSLLEEGPANTRCVIEWRALDTTLQVILARTRSEYYSGFQAEYELRPGRNQMKMLIIDSDRNFVEMYTAWLKTFGYEIHRAYTGEQARAKWLEHQPNSLS